jgi:uncharacterized protein YkwD
MLQLINFARTNPAAAAQRFTSNLNADTQDTLSYYHVDLNAVKAAISAIAPQQPLAWNDQLANAAQSHSQDMANNNFESHIGSDGSTPDQRMDRAGYTNRITAAENAYSYASSVDNAMESFLIDWGVPDAGHRRNLLQPGVSADQSFTDVGVGIVDASKIGVGPFVVTQDFGRQTNSQAKIVGVAFNDKNGDNFYEPGEGLGGVHIEAKNLATGQVSGTDTWDAGGYELALNPGTYQVNAKIGGQVVQSQQVSIGTQNVEVDFNLNNPPPPPPAPVVAPPAPVTAPPVVTPPVVVIKQAAVVAPATPVVTPTTSTPVTSPQTQPSSPQNTNPLANFNADWVVSWTSWNASDTKGA